MRKIDFYNAAAMVDKFFNMSTFEVADGKLTTDEIEALCTRAQNYVRNIYIDAGEGLTVKPSRYNDADTDFAGYEIEYYATGEILFTDNFEFDWRAQGVDVVASDGVA